MQDLLVITQNKIKLLSISFWGIKEVKDYFNVSQHTAERYIMTAKDNFKGKVKLSKESRENLASVDSIIKNAGGISREDELNNQLNIYKALKGC